MNIDHVNSGNVLVRPKRRETEEDLLREHERFLEMQKNQTIDLSVKNIVKKDKKQTPKLIEKKLEIGEITGSFDIQIVERDISNVKVFPPTKTTCGFPKPTRRNQDRELYRPRTSGQVTCGSSTFEENDKLLESLGPQEIEKMRSQIFSTLSAEKINFLKNRQKNALQKKQPPENESQTKKMVMEIELTDETDASKEMKEPIVEPKYVETMKTQEEDYPIALKEARKLGWLHMEKLEKDKLEWTRPLITSDNIGAGQDARFAFDGSLVTENKPVTAGLHHHGDQPDQAGYKINELYTLIQSSFPPQKIMSLKMLSAIMDKVHRGYYDCCFNTLLAREILDETEILLTVRMCLDDPAETVITQALNCLASLICNTTIDEYFLDRYYPFMSCELWLTVVFPEIEKIDELKDIQVVKTDAVRGLLRVDLLPRIRFLLDNNFRKRNDPGSLDRIFDILIRIARHSSDACDEIIATPFLLETLIESFLPASIDFSNDSFYGSPHPKAIKVLRLLLNSSHENCKKIIDNHLRLSSSLQMYLTLSPDIVLTESKLNRSNILKISIEALRCWHVILDQDVVEARQCFIHLFPVIFKQLQFLLTLQKISNAYDFQYGTVLIKCLITLSLREPNMCAGYTRLLENLVFTWIRKIVNDDELPSTDVACFIAVGIEYLLIVNTQVSLLRSSIIVPILSREKIMRDLCHSLIQSSFFGDLTGEYRIGGTRDALALPSFGAVLFGGDQLKLASIGEENMFHLFHALIGVVAKIGDAELIRELLDNQGVIVYCQSVVNRFKVDESIFKSIEFDSVSKLSLLSNFCGRKGRLLYFKLATICVSSKIEKDIKESLLNLVVFNREMIQACYEQGGITAINEMKEIYFKSSTFDSYWWFFDPIFRAYKDPEEFQLTDFEVKLVLQFIELLLAVNGEFLGRIFSDVVLFCSISTVFLLESEPFHHDESVKILIRILKFFKNGNINIGEKLETLKKFHNVQSFFDNFIAHYESVSYGNPLFTDYLRIFFGKKCDQYFRDRLLSDYVHILRYVDDQSNSLINKA